MSRWDTVVMIDWSGGNQRPVKPTADAIWACRARAGVAEEPVYLRSRQAAERWIRDMVAEERAAGRRVLIGFDFPFGFPKGFARSLAGVDDPFAVWAWLEARIEDTLTANNRFDVAGQINALFPGVGPFWGNGLKRDITDLPRKGTIRTNHAMPEKRAAETRAKGAFPVWQLSGAGAVGGQVLMGLPVLHRLRRDLGMRVWPFEPLESDLAAVEIWPSLTVGPAPEGWIKDQWQVFEVARVVSALSSEKLAEMLDVDAPEEGWIFGLGHEAELQGLEAPPKLKNDCFALPQGVDWTPVNEALDLLRSRLHPVVGQENVSVAEALDRVLAEDVAAIRAHPAAANTAVDGYGFGGGREAGLHVLPLVTDRAAAGSKIARKLPAGSAIRILTGAALPDGVDTVVLQEDVTVSQDRVAFHGPVRAGANTRRAGEDVVAGDHLFASGHRIAAQDLALLAAAGVGELKVNMPLRVGVISTGDELIEAGAHANPGQIYDANRPMLLGLVKRLGHIPVDMGQVPDDRTALQTRLDVAAAEADVIITSGGASAGDEDHVSALLSETGTMALWRVAIKPGRPLAIGIWNDTPVFGLPGNPVAAMVCTLVFARPALALMAGEGWPEMKCYMLPAAFEKTKKAGRREYLRARSGPDGIEVFASEGSGRISGLSWADGLVELEDEARQISHGDPVRFIPWAGFGL